MAKNDPAEQDVTLNMAQLVELVQSMAKANMLDAEAISTIAAKAATTASETLKDQWWNEAKYPNISAFNPAGEKAHPRPELKGDVYWAGYLLRGDELTREEIDLLNQVQPGSYRMRDRVGRLCRWSVSVQGNSTSNRRDPRTVGSRSRTMNGWSLPPRSRIR